MDANRTQVPGGVSQRIERVLLSRLDMELTERCTNNCAHCYINLPADDAEAKARELSTAEIQGILKQAASLGCLQVRFTGGEPMLRDDFTEIYLFARRQGMRVKIFTNATLITPQMADLLYRVRPLSKLEIGIYGMHRESYEGASRTPGSYEAAWRGINLLLEKRIPFMVKGAILPSNKPEIAEFQAWADTIPWQKKRIVSLATFFLLRGRHDSEAANQRIAALRLSPEEGLAMVARRPDAYLKDMREFSQKYMGPPGEKIFSCGAATGGGCVDAYGMLQPCMLLRHPDVTYDLRNGTLEDALTRFFPQVRGTKATNPDYLARCAHCFLKGMCEQCPARSWSEHGTLDTPVAYLCESAHAQARYLGWLGENERAWEVEDWRDRLARFASA